MVDSRCVGPPSLKTFSRLYTLEFDSSRKRMSVVVRTPSGSLGVVVHCGTGTSQYAGPGPVQGLPPGRIVVVTKGAESSVLPLCNRGPVQQTDLHISQCARQGLRSATARDLPPPWPGPWRWRSGSSPRHSSTASGDSWKPLARPWRAARRNSIR